MTTQNETTTETRALPALTQKQLAVLGSIVAGASTPSEVREATGFTTVCSTLSSLEARGLVVSLKREQARHGVRSLRLRVPVARDAATFA
jgi:hypothetical protein